MMSPYHNYATRSEIDALYRASKRPKKKRTNKRRPKSSPKKKKRSRR